MLNAKKLFGDVLFPKVNGCASVDATQAAFTAAINEYINNRLMYFQTLKTVFFATGTAIPNTGAGVVIPISSKIASIQTFTQIPILQNTIKENFINSEFYVGLSNCFETCLKGINLSISILEGTPYIVSMNQCSLTKFSEYLQNTMMLKACDSQQSWINAMNETIEKMWKMIEWPTVKKVVTYIGTNATHSISAEVVISFDSL